MEDSLYKVRKVVHEALTARGWTDAEASQMIRRLSGSPEPSPVDIYASLAIPFGKYKGTALGKIAEVDMLYLHWLYRQRWLGEKFALVKTAIQYLVFQDVSKR